MKTEKYEFSKTVFTKEEAISFLRGKNIDYLEDQDAYKISSIHNWFAQVITQKASLV